MEFWTLLNFILIYTKPNSILELGSGRSTFYLYEYAIGYEKKLNSIEHNYKFYRYIKKNLRSIFNNDCDFVTFAPIKKNWYETKNISNNFDFLFIDGPNKKSFIKNNKSFRNSDQSINFLKDKIHYCKIIIIDDTHRDQEKDLIKKLKINLSFLEFIYNDNNSLRIYFQNEYEDYINEISNRICKFTDKKRFQIIKKSLFKLIFLIL